MIRGEMAIKFSDILPGMYLGTTASKQPDGNFLASEVHVFSEDQRGTGEGHRPLGVGPPERRDDDQCQRRTSGRYSRAGY